MQAGRLGADCADAIISTEMENPRIEEENKLPAPNTLRRILAILCLVPYALLGWLRFSQGLTYRDYFNELKIWPGPQYVIFSGLAIGIGFSLLMLVLLLRARFAPPLARYHMHVVLGLVVGRPHLAGYARSLLLPAGRQYVDQRRDTPDRLCTGARTGLPEILQRGSK